MNAIAQVLESVRAGVSEQEAGLVFHQYGDQYFLSQIWMTRDGDGRELNRSSDERRAAAAEQNLASNGKKLRRVEISAHAR